MKKSLIAGAILLAGAASLPIIGNSVMQTTIDERLVKLQTYGIETKKDNKNQSYLTTSRHFEFEMQDSKAFMAFLSNYSDKQIPVYSEAMLNGVVMGADITYSNLPFAKAVEIDLYPLKLPTVLSDNVYENDPMFFSSLEKFLHKKGIMYHLEYNFLNDDFKGNIKDIEEKYLLKDGTSISFGVVGAKFSGNGSLLAPQRVDSSFKKVEFTIAQDKRAMQILLEKFRTSNNFESKSTYITSLELKNIKLKTSGTNDDGTLILKKIRVNASSNDQGDKVELNSKTSIAEVLVSAPGHSLSMSKFNFDVALSELDKKSVKGLTELFSDQTLLQTKAGEERLQALSLELISKGFVFEIGDLSLSDMMIDKKEDFQGFTIKSEVSLAGGKDLKDKIKISPLMALSNLKIDTDIKISQKIYSFLSQNRPMLKRFQNIAKIENQYLIYKLELKDSKVLVNGKALN